MNISEPFLKKKTILVVLVISMLAGCIDEIPSTVEINASCRTSYDCMFGTVANAGFLCVDGRCTMCKADLQCHEDVVYGPSYICELGVCALTPEGDTDTPTDTGDEPDTSTDTETDTDTGLECIGENLISNGGGEAGDMSGWTIIDNGSWVGWTVLDEDPYLGQYLFATSSSTCSRSQEIDLIARGFTEEELDGVPDIMVEEWIRQYDVDDIGIDHYYVAVELRDENGDVLDSWRQEEDIEEGELDWFRVFHSFSGYGEGLRYIYFEDGGRERESNWLHLFGSYGPRMDDALARVCEPGAGDADTDTDTDTDSDTDTDTGTETDTDPDTECANGTEGCPCDRGECGHGLVCDGENNLCRAPLSCSDVREDPLQICHEVVDEMDAGLGDAGMDAGESDAGVVSTLIADCICQEQCEAGYIWDSETRACYEESCDRDARFTRYYECAAEARKCDMPDGGVATCGDCVGGYIEDMGLCRQTYACEQQCDLQNRACNQEATSDTDAVCGDCNFGYCGREDANGEISCLSTNDECVDTCDCECKIPSDAGTENESDAGVVCDENRYCVCEMEENGELSDTAGRFDRCKPGYYLEYEDGICVERDFCGDRDNPIMCEEDEFCINHTCESVPENKKCEDGYAYSEATKACVQCFIDCDKVPGTKGRLWPYAERDALTGDHCVCETQTGYFWDPSSKKAEKCNKIDDMCWLPPSLLNMRMHWKSGNIPHEDPVRINDRCMRICAQIAISDTPRIASPDAGVDGGAADEYVIIGKVPQFSTTTFR